MMKSREERKAELLQVASGEHGEAVIMLMCNEKLGTVGDITTPVTSLIEALLDHEFPDFQKGKLVPDPNLNAARIVGEATAASGLPADMESAWAQWSASIQNVDERGMTLLRAAFEAGYEAGASNSSS